MKSKKERKQRKRKESEEQEPTSSKAARVAIARLEIVATQSKFSNAKVLDGFESVRKGQPGQLVLSGRY